MFNTDITIPSRTSEAVSQLIVNLVRGDVLVQFKNGYTYHYTNVSRRAITNLIINPNMSLGFWVNENCVSAKRTDCLKLNLA